MIRYIIYVTVTVYIRMELYTFFPGCKNEQKKKLKNEIEIMKTQKLKYFNGALVSLSFLGNGHDENY